MINTFSTALSFVETHGYLIIFIAMVIEGPFVTVASAFAASLGIFNVYIIFLLALLGDLTGDFLHYTIGLVGRKTIIERYEIHSGLKIKIIKSLEAHLKNHLGKTLLVTKFTPILTTPSLVLSGALKVPIRKFLFFSFLIALPKTLFFILVGFYFGIAFDRISKYFNLGRYALLLVIVLFFVGYLIYRKLLNKVAKETEKIEKI